MDVAPAVIACSLDGPDMGRRIGDWRALLARVSRRERLIGGLRLQFDRDVPAADVAALAIAERDCCPFFTFVLTIDRAGLSLAVTAPADAHPLLEDLFA